MHVCTKISKATIKFILKIIYKISKYYCMWYQDNFSYQAIDWDHLYDEWNETTDFGNAQEDWMHIGTGEDL